MASHRCAPRAGLCAFAERSADQKRIVITALDLVKGRGRELVHFDFAVPTEFYVWDISLDASRIALLQAALGKIVILPVETRGERRDFTVKSWKGLASFDWTADGSGFFSSALTARGSVLLRVDVNGDARVLWEVRGGTSVWAVPSPDGQHLVLSSFLVGGNIWTIKDF